MNANGKQSVTSKSEEPSESVVRLIRDFGYPIEVFQNVETEDHYLLDVYRIPHGKNNKTNTPKPVVFVLHGLMTSCADYLVMGPDRSLGYILADRGYDVWLGNPRGSKFSLKHKKFDPKKDKEYWNFSYHEIGIYDIPAMLALIKNTTHCDKISCIATSQGTTSFYVLFSEKPQYCEQIKILICMAPIHTCYNVQGPMLKVLAKNHFIWKPLADALGWTSFPLDFIVRLTQYMRGFCGQPGLIQKLTKHIVFIINGYDEEQLNVNEIPAILSHIPNPTSVVHFKHFSQSALTGEFKKFDHGPKENLSRYGQSKPPFYDLSKTVCPVALYYSNGGDWICSHLDVADLKKKLPNVVVDHVIEYPKFNHMDFVFAKDVVDLLYKHIYPVLDKYSL